MWRCKRWNLYDRTYLKVSLVQDWYLGHSKADLFALVCRILNSNGPSSFAIEYQYAHSYFSMDYMAFDDWDKTNVQG
jgi:hypothetical protein